MPIIQANVPDELIALPQWVLWRYIQKPGEPKPTKVPHTCMGYRASHSNPDHWSTFEFALKAAARPGFADGVGFVFTADDPYCGIDLDNVWQSDADEGAEWATEILERFNDTYLEESPSGHGVKIWCQAKAPRCGKWPVEYGAIEIYDRNRFFTVTARSNRVLTVADHQQDIERLIQNLGNNGNAAGRAPVIRIDRCIPQGQRHNTLVSLAGSMWRRGMCVGAIEAALLKTNEEQCDPPHSPEHVHKIVESMQRWER